MPTTNAGKGWVRRGAVTATVIAVAIAPAAAQGANKGQTKKAMKKWNALCVDIGGDVVTTVPTSWRCAGAGASNEEADAMAAICLAVGGTEPMRQPPTGPPFALLGCNLPSPT
jgi:hypothetical protein